MTAVFVHGVPETGDIWQELRDHLPGNWEPTYAPSKGAAAVLSEFWRSAGARS
jgi:hypothetical protein